MRFTPRFAHGAGKGAWAELEATRGWGTARPPSWSRAGCSHPRPIPCSRDVVGHCHTALPAAEQAAVLGYKPSIPAPLDFPLCKARNQAWLRDQMWITQLSPSTRQLFCPCSFPKLKIITSPGLRDSRICQTQAKFALVKSFQCQNQMLKRQPWEPYSELLLKPDGQSKAGEVRAGTGTKKATAAAPQLLHPASPCRSRARLPHLPKSLRFPRQK